MTNVLLIFFIVFIIEMIVLWYYFTNIEPKLKTIYHIVDKTGLDRKNVKAYLKYVAPGAVKEVINKELTPERLEKLGGFVDLKSPGLYSVLRKSHYLKGDDFIQWLEKGFSLNDAAEYSNYHISLESAEICKQAGINGPDFSVLHEHEIQTEKALNYLKSGINPMDIITMVAQEIGLTPDERLFFVKKGIKTNDEISFLLQNNVDIDILSNFKYWGKQSGPRILELVRKNKLNGEIYHKWRELGFSHREMGICLDSGYPLEETMEWRNHEFSVEEMHRYKEHGFTLERTINFRRKQRNKKD